MGPLLGLDAFRYDNDMLSRETKVLVVILLLAAVLRGGLFIIAQPWEPEREETILRGSKDILSYHYLAHDLVLYGRYGGNPEADPYNLDPVIRPAGYALFIALIYALFGTKLWLVPLVQVLLSIASCWLLFRLVSNEFGFYAGAVSSLMFAIYPNSILFSVTPMTETLFIFVSLLFLLYFSFMRRKLSTDSSLREVLLLSVPLGFLMGLMVYVRVSTVYFSPILVAVLVMSMRLLFFKQKVFATVVSILSLALTLLPYYAYMYQRYGTPKLTMVGEYNLLLNTVGHSLGGRETRLDPDVLRIKSQILKELNQRIVDRGLDLRTSNPYERAPIYMELFREKFEQYRLEIIRGILLGMIRFWMVPDRVWEIVKETLPSESRFTRILASSTFLFAILHLIGGAFGAAVGLYIAFKRGYREWLVLALITSLYFTVVTNASGNDRYRMQAVVFLMPLVGLGYSVLYQQTKLRSKVQ